MCITKPIASIGSMILIMGLVPIKCTPALNICPVSNPNTPSSNNNELSAKCTKRNRIRNNPERLITSVITSYSIHYTKLYEKWDETVSERKYICIVEGEMPEKEDTLMHYLYEATNFKVYICDDPTKGQSAVLHYKVLT